MGIQNQDIASFFEFSSPADLELLKEISEKTHYVLFQPVEDGWTKLSIRINYFDELASSSELNSIFREAIESDDVLADSLSALLIPDTAKPKVDEFTNKIKQLESMTGLDTEAVLEYLFKRVELENLTDDKGAERIIQSLLDAADEIISELPD